MDEHVALVVGGSNGIGLSMVTHLLMRQYGRIYIADRCKPDMPAHDKVQFVFLDLLTQDFSALDALEDVDTLIITAGFGRVAAFADLSDMEIRNIFEVNTISALRLIRHFYDRINSDREFFTIVMGSVSGYLSSPLLSVYGSSKAAICKFVESVNIELEMSGTQNRILNVSPGTIKGTRFAGGRNDISANSNLACEMLDRMFRQETYFIPEYNEIYSDVFERYSQDAHEFGLQSYAYKQEQGMGTYHPVFKTGYLSGTFDRYGVEDLKLLRWAREQCDRLVVGVRRDCASQISFKERLAIARSIRYVDEAVEAPEEDTDARQSVRYDYLFAAGGSKGMEQFLRYEELFRDSEVKVLYAPY